MSLETLREQFPCELTRLEPFGLSLQSSSDANRVSSLPVETLRELILQHRLVLIRGLPAVVEKDRFSEIASGWGELLEWEFGTVFEVAAHPDPTNYLFTPGSVPYHWDGAFAAQVPWLQFFQCREAPGEDFAGETIFCDTAALWNSLPKETQQRWKQIEVEYTTDKVAHYGGAIRVPLTMTHPRTEETVLRFAEPANTTTVPLNTPNLSVSGIPAEETARFLAELTELIYDPRFVYAHRWHQGDYLLADNHVLLHGRNAYTHNRPRCLWRVHVL